ncbi:hypothetical protein AALP_AAs69120U000200 [Arabis alpina]|uniref:Uncharacterized protein n=1 Tax=Arabis alpina TaxID=50452 RepID=A0A087G345_ARAAL|nr:hypothetical protein AALP_AAs69120U000200 [Arabis alpina]
MVHWTKLRHLLKVGSLSKGVDHLRVVFGRMGLNDKDVASSVTTWFVLGI